MARRTDRDKAQATYYRVYQETVERFGSIQAAPAALQEQLAQLAQAIQSRPSADSALQRFRNDAGWD